MLSLFGGHFNHVPARGVALGVANRTVVCHVPVERMVGIFGVCGVVDVNHAVASHEVEVVFGYGLGGGVDVVAACEHCAA